MNLAKWISMTEAFESSFECPPKEAVKVVVLTGASKGEGDKLMKDSDSRRLYNMRGTEPPTSNSMLPNTKDIMITSNPMRLYNRRGPALPNTTSPPELSNPRSALKKTVSPEELQRPGGSYIKKYFTVESDALGWGFVVRGNRPCHIQAVEPHGPAAVAGMKVCQFVVSINYQNVVDMDYKGISQLIRSGPRKIVMGVIEEKQH